MINVTILFLSKVQEYAGEEKTVLRLPDESDVASLFRELIRQKPAMKDITKFLFVSVNDVMAPGKCHLNDGDTVRLFFRMGGG